MQGNDLIHVFEPRHLELKRQIHSCGLPSRLSVTIRHGGQIFSALTLIFWLLNEKAEFSSCTKQNSGWCIDLTYRGMPIEIRNPVLIESAVQNNVEGEYESAFMIEVHYGSRILICDPAAPLAIWNGQRNPVKVLPEGDCSDYYKQSREEGTYESILPGLLADIAVQWAAEIIRLSGVRG